MTGEEELQGGIRNALERGVPIEKIVQTFINAGYSSADVQSAARAATEGATTIAPQASANSFPVSKTITPEKVPESNSSLPIVSPPVSQPMQKATQNQEETKNEPSNLKIILLVVVLIALLGALVASLLFREQILGLLA